MTTIPHRDIRALTPNTHVESVYSLVNPQLGTTRNGKPYLKCLLRDATGEIAARQWTVEEGMIHRLQDASFVRVSGHTQKYQQQIQLIVEQIDPVDVDESDLAVLLPASSRDVDEMFAELTTALQRIEHPAMQALVQAYLDDEELMGRFRQAPAAVSLHHAYLGGLLEHTLQLLNLADRMLPLYPKLNRDIVMVGLFLHDMGKTAELSWEQGFSYTPDGQLVGHIVRGAIWLQFKAAIAGKQSGHRLPPEALRVLQHIILSHHGVPEYGAAKLPSTPEAIFIAMLDNLDARTAMALTNARPDESPAEDTGDFTDKVWALGTKLYRPDPLAEAAAGHGAT